MTVVLHGTCIPENIGAAARAMANTGFSRLALSCPVARDWDKARQVAVSAETLVDAAPRTATLAEALAGSAFVVGTTARDRRYWGAREIREAAPEILDLAARGPVALLFGPEQSGLSNEDLTLCRMVVTIPSVGPLASYNLGQAVLLVLYELMMAGGGEREFGGGKGPPAPVEEMEGMYGHLEELLLETGFLWKDNPDHMMRAVRAFLNRADPTSTEVVWIRGAIRRLLFNLKNR